jgi:hypothetical protein
MLQESLPQNWTELAAAAVEWADKPIEIGDVLYTKMRGAIAKTELVTALENLLAIQPVVAKVELEPLTRKLPQVQQSAAPPPSNDQPLKTIEEAAAKLRKTASWMRAHSNGSREPTIPRIKMGKGYAFDDKDLDEFLASCRETVKRKRK